jgi:amino acid adenylation domain-containing protein
MGTMTAGNESQNQLENLEDLYELAPMQQGMLFHSIYSPDSGTYFEQSLFTIKGELNFDAFEGAWRRVLQRHSILRTAFLWEELEKPLQAVYRRVELPLETDDWRFLSVEERERRLQSFIDNDRSQGFELSSAPLIRLALLRFTDDEYKFLFSRHHLVLDRWSRALLLKDVYASYHALSEGREPSLEAARPYVDYIAWLKSQDANAAERFWRNSLADFTGPTSLGIERADKGEDRYGDRRIRLSEEATAKLSDFARQHRLTLNTLVQGVWALLLSRYSGEDDVLFGVTVAGRPAELAGAESIVGLFINTLPLRVRVPPASSVRSWLATLQAQQSELQQFEYSSLVDIQGWSDVPRGVPLFESILVFENLPVGSNYQAAGGNVEFRDDRGIGSTTGYPLTVLVSPGRQLAIQIVYEVGRYTSEAIDTVLSNLQTLFENLPAGAETSVSRLPLLTSPEREQMLVQWNDTAVPYAGASVLERFEEQVEKTPEAPALIFNDQKLSYSELNQRANQLGNYLCGLGVGPEVRVGICIDRSIEMLVGVLATLKSGGAYVPLDPEYPLDRLRFMVDDARCSVLLTNERVLSRLPETKSTVICLDRDWKTIAGEPDHSPKIEINGENLAYLMYTSGSTGQPKSVAMTHRALANLISWQLEQGGAPARTLQFASLSFDVSFQEIFSTWCSGGALLLVSDELRRDALSLLRFLRQQKVERIFLPFVALQNLAVAAESSGTTPEYLTEIITAGEQLEITPQISKFCERMNDCVLHNHYGPSESHVVTAYSLHAPVSSWPTLPPIGRPIANTQMFILDKNLEPTPIGVSGQLCIGGASLSRGYLNQPSLTAQKFVPNPFSNEPGARLYLTGDLARYERDGNIQFLGRIDNQVKIRGFRVELGEIETVLAMHPSVREAVVVAREDVKGDRKLVGYVVPNGNGLEDHSFVLRGYLKEKLPDYMVPSAFVLIESLPLTASGKINRRALAALVPGEVESVRQYEAPRDAQEEKLAGIWATVLRREQVGIRDNFFELGGHSLVATQLISRVRSAFEVELPLRDLFESPTVAELSSIIVQLQAELKTLSSSTITRHPRDDAAELLMNLDQLSDEDVDALLREVMADSENNE